MDEWWYFLCLFSNDLSITIFKNLRQNKILTMEQLIYVYVRLKMKPLWFQLLRREIATIVKFCNHCFHFVLDFCLKPFVVFVYNLKKMYKLIYFYIVVFKKRSLVFLKHCFFSIECLPHGDAYYMLCFAETYM